MNHHKISIYTHDKDLSHEILEALHEQGSIALAYNSAQELMDKMSSKTTILILDFESKLFQGPDFKAYIRLNHPNIKLVLLTSVENLGKCYQILGGNIFEIVIKNSFTKSKITRIMATLSYYNQFSVGTDPN